MAKKDDNKEIIEAMENAANEIRSLRRVNEVLEAKVSTIELMAAMLFGQPGNRHGGLAHPDPLFYLEQAMHKLENKQ